MENTSYTFQEVAVAKGNPRTAKFRDISIVTIDDNKINVRHSKYKVVIPFNEIISIEKKRGIKITLKNEEIYTMNVIVNAPINTMRGYQSHNIANKTHLQIYNILMENWEKVRV